MVAAPDVTLTVTPPGGSPVDYTAYLDYEGGLGQSTITQQFGRQGDTATLYLTDDYGATPTSPNVIVPTLSRVELVDHNADGEVLIAGYVTNPVQSIASPVRNEWTLNVVDDTFLADSTIVEGTYGGLTADQVIIDLVRNADCGITAASTLDGGFVAPGPQLANLVINTTTLSGAWRTVAQLAGQVVPYGWYVDENRALHFYDASTAQSSGVTFTTDPTAGGSTTEGHILLDGQDLYEVDASSLRNRVLVQGANQTITTSLSGDPTDTWRGDGVTQAWPLRYTLSGTPTLTVGGVTTDVTVVNSGDTPSGAWAAVQNASGGWFLVAAAPPSAGVTIRAWYDYQVPVVAAAQDAASIATYDLTLSEFIQDSSLTTAPMALARAQRERQEYAFAVERASFTVGEDFLGWVRAGWTFQYINQMVLDPQNGYSRGLSDTFIAISNTITFSTGGYRTMSLSGVRI